MRVFFCAQPSQQVVFVSYGLSERIEIEHDVVVGRATNVEGPRVADQQDLRPRRESLVDEPQVFISRHETPVE